MNVSMNPVEHEFVPRKDSEIAGRFLESLDQIVKNPTERSNPCVTFFPDVLVKPRKIPHTVTILGSPPDAAAITVVKTMANDGISFPT